MLRLLANLILAVGVTVGALSAATAYLVPLDAPDETLVGLTLNADAGQVLEPDGSVSAAAEAGNTIDGAMLETLRANVVEMHGRTETLRYVKVKEFSFARWPGKWWFALSVALLLVGGLTLRAESKRALATAEATSTDEESPEAAIAEIRRSLEELRDEVRRGGDERQVRQDIVRHVGEMQLTHLRAFADNRTRLVAKLGMSGYAALMDRFALGERMLNRAWSTAADGHLPEATRCLDAAVEPFRDVSATLGRS